MHKIPIAISTAVLPKIAIPIPVAVVPKEPVSMPVAVMPKMAIPILLDNEYLFDMHRLHNLHRDALNMLHGFGLDYLHEHSICREHELRDWL